MKKLQGDCVSWLVLLTGAAQLLLVFGEGMFYLCMISASIYSLLDSITISLPYRDNNLFWSQSHHWWKHCLHCWISWQQTYLFWSYLHVQSWLHYHWRYHQGLSEWREMEWVSSNLSRWVLLIIDTVFRGVYELEAQCWLVTRPCQGVTIAAMRQRRRLPPEYQVSCDSLAS